MLERSPMAAKILDGKSIAAKVRAEVAAGVARFRDARGRPPGLDVVLVGDDPASQVYVRNKEKAATEVGMRGRVHKMSAATSADELARAIEGLNADDAVD